jgi:hypothetical protein
MIQVCCYRGCGAVYGEKEPLSNQNVTHGLCPVHYKIYMKEILDEFRNEDGRKMAGQSSDCGSISSYSKNQAV